jgi:hypothetical protein
MRMGYFFQFAFLRVALVADLRGSRAHVVRRAAQRVRC